MLLLGFLTWIFTILCLLIKHKSLCKIMYSDLGAFALCLITLWQCFGASHEIIEGLLQFTKPLVHLFDSDRSCDFLLGTQFPGMQRYDLVRDHDMQGEDIYTSNPCQFSSLKLLFGVLLCPTGSVRIPAWCHFRQRTLSLHAWTRPKSRVCLFWCHPNHRLLSSPVPANCPWLPPVFFMNVVWPGIPAQGEGMSLSQISWEGCPSIDLAVLFLTALHQWPLNSWAIDKVLLWAQPAYAVTGTFCFPLLLVSWVIGRISPGSVARWWVAGETSPFAQLPITKVAGTTSPLIQSPVSWTMGKASQHSTAVAAYGAVTSQPHGRWRDAWLNLKLPPLPQPVSLTQ